MVKSVVYRAVSVFGHNTGFLWLSLEWQAGTQQNCLPGDVLPTKLSLATVTLWSNTTLSDWAFSVWQNSGMIRSIYPSDLNVSCAITFWSDFPANYNLVWITQIFWSTLKYYSSTLMSKIMQTISRWEFVVLKDGVILCIISLQIYDTLSFSRFTW